MQVRIQFDEYFPAFEHALIKFLQCLLTVILAAIFDNSTSFTPAAIILENVNAHYIEHQVVVLTAHMVLQVSPLSLK